MMPASQQSPQGGGVPAADRANSMLIDPRLNAAFASKFASNAQYYTTLAATQATTSDQHAIYGALPYESVPPAPVSSANLTPAPMTKAQLAAYHYYQQQLHQQQMLLHQQYQQDQARMALDSLAAQASPAGSWSTPAAQRQTAAVSDVGLPPSYAMPLPDSPSGTIPGTAVPAHALDRVRQTWLSSPPPHQSTAAAAGAVNPRHIRDSVQVAPTVTADVDERTPVPLYQAQRLTQYASAMGPMRMTPPLSTYSPILSNYASSTTSLIPLQSNIVLPESHFESRGFGERRDSRNARQLAKTSAAAAAPLENAKAPTGTQDLADFLRTTGPTADAANLGGLEKKSRKRKGGKRNKSAQRDSTPSVDSGPRYIPIQVEYDPFAADDVGPKAMSSLLYEGSDADASLAEIAPASAPFPTPSASPMAQNRHALAPAASEEPQEGPVSLKSIVQVLNDAQAEAEATAKSRFKTRHPNADDGNNSRADDDETEEEDDSAVSGASVGEIGAPLEPEALDCSSPLYTAAEAAMLARNTEFNARLFVEQRDIDTERWYQSLRRERASETKRVQFMLPPVTMTPPSSSIEFDDDDDNGKSPAIAALAPNDWDGILTDRDVATLHKIGVDLVLLQTLCPWADIRPAASPMVRHVQIQVNRGTPAAAGISATPPFEHVQTDTFDLGAATRADASVGVDDEPSGALKAEADAGVQSDAGSASDELDHMRVRCEQLQAGQLQIKSHYDALLGQSMSRTQELLTEKMQLELQVMMLQKALADTKLGGLA